MSIRIFRTTSKISVAFSVLMLTACATGFVSTWKDPDAKQLEFAGQKVAAVVMMKGESSRRLAEDTLAREITKRGAQGVAMYTLLPGVTPSKDTEALARTAFEKAGIVGAIVMRPLSVDKQMVTSSVTSLDPAYGSYWGGYYGYGWGSPWPMQSTAETQMHLDTIVTVETLVYSLQQNKLVWSGKSQATNPSNVDGFVKQLTADAAKELHNQGLTK